MWEMFFYKVQYLNISGKTLPKSKYLCTSTSNVYLSTSPEKTHWATFHLWVKSTVWGTKRDTPDQPVCPSIGGQCCCVSIEARRVQPVAVTFVDQGAEAGVGVWGGAPGAGLGRADVALGAGAGAGGLALYGGGTGGVQAPHWHPAQEPAREELNMNALYTIQIRGRWEISGFPMPGSEGQRYITGVTLVLSSILMTGNALQVGVLWWVLLRRNIHRYPDHDYAWISLERY